MGGGGGSSSAFKHEKEEEREGGRGRVARACGGYGRVEWNILKPEGRLERRKRQRREQRKKFILKA